MTVGALPTIFRRLGNGVTTVFAFDNNVLDQDFLDVKILTRSTSAVVETLSLGVDYTVTIVSNTTSNVTIINALKIPSVTQDILLALNVPLTQSRSYPRGDELPAASIESGLDKLTLIAQNTSDKIDLSIKLPDSDIGLTTTVPDVGTRAGNYLAFDASGNVIAAAGTGGTAISAPLVPFVQAASLVAAKALLITAGSIATADIANSAVTNAKIATGSVTPDRLSTGGLYWDASGNVGIGTTSLGSNDFLVSESKPAGQVQASIVNTNTGGTSASYIFASQGAVQTLLSSYGNSFGQTGTATGSNHPFIFLTNGVERGRFDTSGNFLFNSGYGSVATAYGCRAWVNFDGTGTVSIRASGNVSSITDNGVGNYNVNFLNAMPNANYTVSIGNQFISGAGTPRFTSINAGRGSNGFNILNGGRDAGAFALSDVSELDVCVFR